MYCGNEIAPFCASAVIVRKIIVYQFKIQSQTTDYLPSHNLCLPGILNLNGVPIDLGWARLGYRISASAVRVEYLNVKNLKAPSIESLWVTTAIVMKKKIVTPLQFSNNDRNCLQRHSALSFRILIIIRYRCSKWRADGNPILCMGVGQPQGRRTMCYQHASEHTYRTLQHVRSGLMQQCWRRQKYYPSDYRIGCFGCQTGPCYVLKTPIATRVLHLEQSLPNSIFTMTSVLFLYYYVPILFFDIYIVKFVQVYIKNNI